MTTVEPTTWSDWSEVPDVAADAPVDPHWQELVERGRSGLPAAYLPAVTATSVRGWRRGAAWVLVAMITTTTAGGICLTYGPEELFRVLRG